MLTQKHINTIKSFQSALFKNKSTIFTEEIALAKEIKEMLSGFEQQDFYIDCIELNQVIDLRLVDPFSCDLLEEKMIALDENLKSWESLIEQAESHEEILAFDALLKAIAELLDFVLALKQEFRA